MAGTSLFRYTLVIDKIKFQIREKNNAITRSKESKENLYHPVQWESGPGAVQRQLFGGAGRIRGHHGRIRFGKNDPAQYSGFTG